MNLTQSPPGSGYTYGLNGHNLKWITTKRNPFLKKDLTSRRGPGAINGGEKREAGEGATEKDEKWNDKLKYVLCQGPTLSCSPSPTRPVDTEPFPLKYCVMLTLNSNYTFQWSFPKNIKQRK